MGEVESMVPDDVDSVSADEVPSLRDVERRTDLHRPNLHPANVPPFVLKAGVARDADVEAASPRSKAVFRVDIVNEVVVAESPDLTECSQAEERA
jgi:hypothetical protein